MNQDRDGWFAAAFVRLSTGMKMFLLLSLCLLPLGLITVLASIDTARNSSAKRAEQTLQRLDLKAQRIHELLQRTTASMRSASAAIAMAAPGAPVCLKTLDRLARTQGIAGRYALYSKGRVRCASTGYAPPTIARSAPGRSVVAISADSHALRFALFDDAGMIEGSGEFPRESLAALTTLPGPKGGFDLELLQGGRAMALSSDYVATALIPILSEAVVVDGALKLRMRVSAAPISAVDILLILLPVMMWIGAATFGWLIVDRLLLRPLMRMQRAVSAYQPGDEHVDIPVSSSPAHEIGELAFAFNKVTRTVARHEAELGAALARQTRLVREVHHRVKNNLQVVASLLNLHARAAVSEDAAAAYASIQRRVDALAVVHRNHFAELEENRGVALRPLVSELGANLRGTAPPAATHMAIQLDIEPLYATQDVAVAVAFLITEIVEFAMFCEAKMVTVSLHLRDPASAVLMLESDSLRKEQICDRALFDRFDRIVTGLSRQLRSAIERDTENGRYTLAIAIVGTTES